MSDKAATERRSRHQGRGTSMGMAGFEALGEPTRRSIVDLLGERPATVTELATALDKAKGTIAHHVKVLVDARLVEVVSTRRVRAIEERTYGRTAPTFIMPADALDKLPALTDSWMLADASASARQPEDHEAGLASTRFARIPHDRAEEFERRIIDLLDDFVAEPRDGAVVYGLMVALFPTDRPHLPEPPA